MTITENYSNELVVFDFDETIVDCNSDTFINVLAPDQKIPEEIWNNYSNEKDWTEYMQQVFHYLHRFNITQKDYENCLAKMPFVKGIKKLIRALASPPKELNRVFEVIIISDANSFFINSFLKYHKLSHVFKNIFTNRAHFDESGCLHIERFHEQDWCNLSARNICKGHILKDYIAKSDKKFDRISYCGDGSNDLCPSLKLSSNDLVFSRFGYVFHKLALAKVESKELTARLIPFVCGNDIWKVLSSKKNSSSSIKEKDATSSKS